MISLPRPTRSPAARSPFAALSLALMLAGSAAPARAQAPREAADTARAGAESALQERWAAPFAVESVGRPAARGDRPVVVVAAPAAASAPVTEPMPAPEPAPAAAPVSPAPTTPASRASAPPRAPASAPARPAMAARTHRVEWGETWYGIAREYRVTPRDLAAANPTVDPEHLRSGEVLRIPRTAAAAGARSHRVVAGETLWGISRRYGVAAAEVRRLNRMPDDKVRTGQLLIIPQEDTRR